MDTTVIIPAYNEEVGIGMTLSKIQQVLPADSEIMVVDDGSVDKTCDIASGYSCIVIKHSINRGKGEAIKTGISYARGDKVIWIDADDTYPAELIPEIILALNSYDAVVCSRLYGRENIPAFNRVGNWIFKTMIQKIYGFAGQDVCSGLYGVKLKWLKMMNLKASKFSIEPEVSIKAARMKLKVLDIPITYNLRVGESNLNPIRVGFEDLFRILSLVFWRVKSSDEESDIEL